MPAQYRHKIEIVESATAVRASNLSRTRRRLMIEDEHAALVLPRKFADSCHFYGQHDIAPYYFRLAISRRQSAITFGL